MEDKGLKHNYVFTIVKLILFLIIFCFLAELTRGFWREIRAKKNLDTAIFILGVVFPFAFYVFLADLNDFYRKIQNFFFRSSFFALVFPAPLIILGLGYFLIPKILNLTFSRDIFVFLGGFIFTTHLMLIARETKGDTFTSFIHYLFIFSILYILNLIFFGVYLKVSFNIQLGELILEGAKDGANLIKTVFSQALR